MVWIIFIGLVVMAVGVCLYDNKTNKPKDDIDYVINDLEWYIIIDRMIREGDKSESSKADEKICSNIEKLIDKVKE